MSFNENNINNNSSINRNNYEEYFLLYVDEELTAEEKLAVENFVIQNPDLQEELHILLSTKLTAEDAVFLDKEDLLASNMAAAEVDETLLLYIDDELPEEDKAAVEHKIQTNEGYNLQHQLLLKTKLDANEAVIFPNKKELYRKTGSLIAVPVWLRVAAAVAVVLSGALFMLYESNNNNNSTASIAQHTNKAVQHKETGNEVITFSLPEASEPKIALKENTEEANISYNNINKSKQVKSKSVEVKELSEKPALQQEVLASNVLSNKIEENIAIAPIKVDNAPKQNINNITVTPEVSNPYHNTEASAITMVSYDADEDNSSRNKTPLKGFLRKATRFIERTTNIKPTNEDDELLIGAISLKVK